VESRFADAFAENMARGYEKETGIVPQIYICAPAEGAGAIRSSSVGEKSG
jgi:galactokinase